MPFECHQDLSALQISNNTALIVKAIIQDFGYDDDGSSQLTSFSASSPSIPTSSAKIELHIGKWAKVADRPVTTVEDGIAKVRGILTYFISAACENGLGNTPAVATLTSAIETARRGLDPNNTTPIIWTDKVSQHTRAHTPSYTLQLKTFVVNSFPLFNIFDAMAFIYTICVEDLFIPRECELHLYQFRLLIRAFYHNMWHNRKFLPTTVAATWNQVEIGKPLTVGFATTCIGSPDARRHMNTARRVFCEGVLTLANESQLELCPPPNCPNFPGNCPQFLAWGMVCRNEGECLNIPRDETYQYCGQCQAMASVALSGKKITINDMWRESTLLTSSEVILNQQEAYHGCRMKDTQSIINERSGRKIKR